MVCLTSGVDDHPKLKRTAADVVAEKAWKPPEGGDQWSDQDTAEPTVYEGRKAAHGPPPRRQRQARRKTTGAAR